MPICAPCRVPHTTDVYEDTTTGRHDLARRCYCRHTPHTEATHEVVADLDPKTGTTDERSSDDLAESHSRRL